jgi:hypothetical protein
MRATHLKNLALAVAATIGLTSAQILAVTPESTISYQAQLSESGLPAIGSFDLQFKLFDKVTGGTQIGPTVVKSGVSVADGIFTAELDFGAGAFTGEERFIEIAVREAGVGAFVTLVPRQKVTAAPMAQFAIASQAAGSCDCPFAVSGSTLSFISGSVGIGTGSPEAPLHVLEGSAGTITAHSNSSLALERSANNYLNMLTPDANESGLLFGNPTAGATAGGIIFNASTTLDGLQLRTGGNQTRMTIDGTGKVGIGTSAPLEALHVRTATGSPLTTVLITPGTTESDSQIKMTENNAGTLGSIMRVDGATNSWQLIGLTSSGETGPHLVVNRDNGNVGIGTSGPATSLHVFNPGFFDTIARVEASNGDARLSLMSDSDGEAQVYSPDNTNDLRFRLGTTDRMTILSNGNVGIGTTAPTARLQVTGLIHSTVGGIRFPDGTTQTTATISGPQGADGPPGIPGPPGAPATSMAICAEAGNCDNICDGEENVLAAVVSGDGCSVTSDTGSCSQPNSPGSEACCVCKQP